MQANNHNILLLDYLYHYLVCKYLGTLCCRVAKNVKKSGFLHPNHNPRKTLVDLENLKKDNYLHCSEDKNATNTCTFKKFLQANYDTTSLIQTL